MIVHIVMFQFKEAQKEENMLRAKAKLEALVETIEPLLTMEVGLNFAQSERALDMVLTSTFASVEDLKAYAVHPDHMAFLEFAKSCVEFTKIVDYER